MRRIVPLLGLLLVSGTAGAEGRPAYKLELKEVPELPNGKIIAIEGTADREGHKFFVEHLNVMQPVAVTVLTKNKADDVKLKLGKYRWDEFNHEGSTRGEGKKTFQVRTEGEMRVLVTADAPTPYQLMVWAGEPVKPDLPPLVVPKREFLARTGGGSGAKIAAAVAVALAVFGIGAFLLLRRRKARA